MSEGSALLSAVASARNAIEIGEGGFAAFPGPALLVDRAGRGRGLNPGGVKLLAEVPTLLWRQAAAQITAAAQRGLAVVESLSLGRTVEAMVVPLADGASALVVARDPGLEESLREALIESRQRFKALVEISSDFAWETDADGTFVFVSPQGALGWSAAQLLGRRAQDFLVDRSDVQTPVFLTDKPLADVDLWFRRADGAAACLSVAAVPILDRDGTRLGARGVCRDLTADRARDDALARARLRDRLMAHLVRTMRDEIEPAKALSAAVSAAGLAVGAMGGAVLRRHADGSFEETAHWGEGAPEQIQERVRERLDSTAELDAVIDHVYCIALPTRFRGASNGAFVLWRHESDGTFGEADRAIILDVADHLGIAIAQVLHHERIVQLSRVDALTGLLNRRAFFEELEQALSAPIAARRSGALLYLDLDNFKLLNDEAGHGAGDEALREFTRILRENTRSSDLVARLGGDEFVVWMPGISAAIAETRARAILRSFGVLTPRIGSAEHPLSVSMGLAVYDPQSDEAAGALLARADHAMYAAKDAGKGQLRFAAASTNPGRALSA